MIQYNKNPSARRRHRQSKTGSVYVRARLLFGPPLISLIQIAFAHFLSATYRCRVNPTRRLFVVNMKSSSSSSSSLIFFLFFFLFWPSLAQKGIYIGTVFVSNRPSVGGAIWESHRCLFVFTECEEGRQFKCNDGQCISIDKKCDRFEDCSRGEDEDNCPFGKSKSFSVVAAVLFRNDDMLDLRT